MSHESGKFVLSCPLQNNLEIEWQHTRNSCQKEEKNCQRIKTNVINYEHGKNIRKLMIRKLFY